MSPSSNLLFYCYLSSVAGDGFPHNNDIDERNKYSRNRFSFHFQTLLGAHSFVGSVIDRWFSQ